MLQNVLNQIKKLDTAQLAKDLKNIKPKELIEEFKTMAQNNLEHLKPQQLVQMASNAMSQAVATTEEEILKGFTAAIHLALQGADGVTEEEKVEATSVLLQFEKTPRGLIDHLKETSGLVLESLPRNLDDLKHFRQCVTKGLLEEARERLAARAEESNSKKIKPKITAVSSGESPNPKSMEKADFKAQKRTEQPEQKKQEAKDIRTPSKTEPTHTNAQVTKTEPAQASKTEPAQASKTTAAPSTSKNTTISEASASEAAEDGTPVAPKSFAQRKKNYPHRSGRNEEGPKDFES